MVFILLKKILAPFVRQFILTSFLTCRITFEKTQHVLKLILKFKNYNTALLGAELEQQCAIHWQCLITTQLCIFLRLHMWVVAYPSARS